MSRRTIFIGLSMGLILLTWMSYNSCSGVRFGAPTKDTVVNNPFNPVGASSQILSALCSVLNRCSSVPTSTCTAGILAVSGIGQRLGLPSGVDDPFSSLENAEQTGAVVASSAQTNTCVQAIENLSCSDPDVQNAYNSSSSQPFAASTFLVPMNSCGQVFPPPIKYACINNLLLIGTAASITTAATGGTTTTYSASPALPAGLTLDPSAGTISGTPTVATPSTAYTVTATSPQGTVTSTINIRTASGWLVNDLTHDAHNTAPGSCNATGFGTCTLRAAIEEINSGSSAKSVVLLPAGSTILSSSLGQIPLSSSMDVYGDCAQGTVVDGANATQIFGVSAGPTSFNNMTIQNGQVNANPGGGIYVKNNGVTTFTVSLNDMTIQNNVVSGTSGPFSWGAGVYVGGTSPTQQVMLNVSNSTFSGNSGAAGTVSGAAIYLDANSQGTINNSSFIQNVGGDGAAIQHAGTNLTVTNSVFSQNNSTNAHMTIGLQAAITGTITLTNDTFDSNPGMAVGSGGGPNATFNVTNCTFTNNSNGALAAFSPSVFNMSNNLFENNGPSYCQQTGTYNSLGGNLSDHAATDCSLTNNDITSTAALIGPLQDNGGPTETIPLLPGSAAIDSANVATCPATDQRGYSRLVDGHCDVGAYESYP